VIKKVWEAAEAQISDVEGTDKRKAAEEDYTDGVNIKIKTVAALFTYFSAASFL